MKKVLRTGCVVSRVVHTYNNCSLLVGHLRHAGYVLFLVCWFVASLWQVGLLLKKLWMKFH